MKELKATTIWVLEKFPKARANDNFLIYKVYQKMGWSTDLREIAKYSENRYDAISRYRRKAQETNPRLLPAKQVTVRRKAREKKMREEMRGL